MSGQYTHFYAQLPLTVQQGEAAQELLKTYTRWVEAKVAGEAFLERVGADDIGLFERIEVEEFGDHVGFEVKITPRDQVVLTDYAGHPNTTLAGLFVQELLERHEIDEAVGLQWACTSTSASLGAFGGGAAIVERRRIEWMNTQDWVDERLEGRKATDDNML